MIIPSISQIDPQKAAEDAQTIAPIVSAIQVGIADQSLVPLKTADDLSWIRKIPSSCLVEAHLMVAKPEKLVANLVRLGCARIIGHVECTDPREFLAEARAYECEVGLAIDVETALEDIEPFLEELDFVQVMTTQAGASGQLLEDETLKKIRAIRRNFPDLPIAAKGGITPETITSVADAGATRFVIHTALFDHQQNMQDALRELQEAAG